MSQTILRSNSSKVLQNYNATTSTFLQVWRWKVTW